MARKAKAGREPVAESPPAAAEVRSAEPRAVDLLVWYDRHRRDLPWRAKPGETADPYRVWLSEIMLQQTTVAAVRPFYLRFLDRFPTVEALAAAPTDAVMQAWAGLGYYSRARNLHACAKAVVERHRGRFPGTEAELLTLPGIGAYTAAAVAAIAFDEPAAAVDGNVERVMSRVHTVDEPLPKAKPQIRALTEAIVPRERPGDFAQALMDLGATICTSKRPACALCPWMRPCRARAEGTQETYPRKVKKVEGQLRLGAAFVVLRADDSVLLRTRPPLGLLGGMAEPPTSEWTPDYATSQAMLDAPLEARWKRLPGIVRHVFTHFPLELTVFFAKVPRDATAPDGMRWTPRAKLGDEALPGSMKKVLVHALGALPNSLPSAGEIGQPSEPEEGEVGERSESGEGESRRRLTPKEARSEPGGGASGRSLPLGRERAEPQDREDGKDGPSPDPFQGAPSPAKGGGLGRASARGRGLKR